MFHFQGTVGSFSEPPRYWKRILIARVTDDADRILIICDEIYLAVAPTFRRDIFRRLCRGTGTDSSRNKLNFKWRSWSHFWVSCSELGVILFPIQRVSMPYQSVSEIENVSVKEKCL